MSADEWWQGGNKQVKKNLHSTSWSGRHTVRLPLTFSSVWPQVEKVSLNPNKQPKPKAAPAKEMPAKKELASKGSKEVRDKHWSPIGNNSTSKCFFFLLWQANSHPTVLQDPARGCSTSSSPLSTPSSSAAPSRSPSSTSGLSSGFLPSPSPSQSAKAIQNLLGMNTRTHRASHYSSRCHVIIIILCWIICNSGPTSKFRHIQGAVMHRDTHITNLRGLNLTTPGESDGFCANSQRVAVPLAISGGQIAILEVRQQLKIKQKVVNVMLKSHGCPFLFPLLIWNYFSSPQRSQPGRLPDTSMPTIQNSVNVVDFSWDPFDTHQLAVGEWIRGLPKCGYLQLDALLTARCLSS